MPEPTRRMRELLAELEAQLIAARDHEDVMVAAREESAGWSRPEDREWIVGAAAEATQARIAAERRLAQGNAIAARAAGAPHA